MTGPVLLPPVIGLSVISDHPAWAYLADYDAARPADEREAAAYPYLYAAYDPWMSVARLAEDGMAFEAAPLTAPAAEPEPEPPAPVQVIPEPEPGSVAELARDRIAGDAAARAQKAAQDALSRWSGAGQGQPPGVREAAGEPDATAVIPAQSAETEAIPAITAETERSSS